MFNTYLGNPCNWFLMVPWIILIKFIFQLKRELRNLLPCKLKKADLIKNPSS